MEPNDKHEIAAIVATAVKAVTEKDIDLAKFISMGKDLDQVRKELDEILEWKKGHEATLNWAKNFMETHRATVRNVLAAGAITIIGLLIQVYYTLGKR